MQSIVKGIDFVCSKCRSAIKGANGMLTVCPQCGELTVPQQRIFGSVRKSDSPVSPKGDLCTRVS